MSERWKLGHARFCLDVSGMMPFNVEEAGRDRFCRYGRAMLWLFNLDVTTTASDVLAHGVNGASHVAVAASATEMKAW